MGKKKNDEMIVEEDGERDEAEKVIEERDEEGRSRYTYIPRCV